ncbi:methionine adenosyltransferase [Coprothermobacter platensis]|uniref:methionine adenosyltransferase n=1 Tax=Coprothermobacter platensis TaxID=108819 RepID=UPI00036CBDBB|nr:methionine adenosyltransferase [Coprothermobacter platensis]
MKTRNHRFTSESVTEGHPDKVADQISDAILDAHLKGDPQARVAVETTVKTNLVVLVGEVTSKNYVDYVGVTRHVLEHIGYTDPSLGFSVQENMYVVNIQHQSEDIALGVDRSLESKSGELEDELGAGDQGMMFGYAVDETENYMPLTIELSHALTKRLSEVRKQKLVDFLRPDGKAQVTVVYDGLTPIEVEHVVVSAQHSPDVHENTLREFIVEEVIKKVIPSELLTDRTHFHINPTGRFVTGGPNGDSGLTGRKIIVDTYGSRAPHGGGSFSGKDPTKVDRSATYAARYLAKNIVAAGLAREALIQLAYVIGEAKPVSIYVDTFGTGNVDEGELERYLMEQDYIELTPKGIIDKFGLQHPEGWNYLDTAAYGHFGKPHFPWEQLDMVPILQEYFSVNACTNC